MPEVVLALLVGTWAVGLMGALLIYHKFRQHSETIRRVTEWQDLMLDKLTKPKKKER